MADVSEVHQQRPAPRRPDAYDALLQGTLQSLSAAVALSCQGIRNFRSETELQVSASCHQRCFIPKADVSVDLIDDAYSAVEECIALISKRACSPLEAGAQIMTVSGFCHGHPSRGLKSYG